jgi:hypothetical protein
MAADRTQFRVSYPVWFSSLHKGKNFLCRVINEHIRNKAALKFGSEAWVLKKREEQRLEAAQMKF